ncbi:hypothetical protein [uncultured Methylobacterium sp.]|uniref:hypothetical protein n=1 Tax=uncultured Methylobacterium sp. TaxID=157278 RepID=UPI0035CA7A18
MRKFLLAALLVLGLAAVAPHGASAAPVGPGLALQTEAAPAVAEKAQYYGRRFYGPRPYYRRPFYGPRPFYRRPYYGRRFYGPRRFYY